MAIVALAAAVRFIRLGHQSFEYDEIVTVSLVHRSLGGMLATIPHSEATPPLYYVLAWLWARIFGTSEAGLRSLSALVGTASVPAAYAAARTMLRNRLAGLTVAAFVSVAPVLVWYSQEARSYALLVFLGALSLLFFARSLDDPSRRNLVGWIAFSALALATHYFAGFLVLGESLVLLWRVGRRATAPIAALVAVSALLAPLAWTQYHSIGGAWSWFEKYSVVARLHELLTRFFFFNYNPGRTPLLVLAVATVAALVYLGRPVGRAQEALVVAALTILVPVVLAYAGLDIFEFRNTLVAWIPVTIALAAGIVALPIQPRYQAVLVACATAGLLGCTIQIARKVELQRGSWRVAVTELQATRQTRVLMPTDVTMLTHYWPGIDRLPARGARVSEVDVIGQGIAGASSLGLHLHGFTLAAKVLAGNMTILRLRASSPQVVTQRELPWPAAQSPLN